MRLLSATLGLLAAAAASLAAPRVQILDPVIVAAGPPEVRRWGFYQFPAIVRWEDGGIAVHFHIAPDAAESYGLTPSEPNRAISIDNGRTWKLDVTTKGVYGLRLKNGDHLELRTPRPLPLASLKLPASLGDRTDQWKNHYVHYRLRELPDELQGIWFGRLPKGSLDWEMERAALTDDQALRYSIREIFPIVVFGQVRRLHDRSLLLCMYPGLMEGQERFYSNVFFYRSTDEGLSWRVQGRIPYQPDAVLDPTGPKRDGFTEPTFEILENRTLVCVMRSEGPMYQSLSSDDGKTWSKPAIIAPNGVYPRLLRLPNGVLALSSGRPGAEVRFSFDKHARIWSAPYRLVPLTAPSVQVDSCGYSDMVAIAKDRLLIVYSWFKYPGSDGQARKAIMVRQVTVRP
ncbi:MAG: glycoside hydrolase [Acidobacteriales bacterium]|nr:glycoside hydrolase [Terriglobales bacterium]